MQQIEKMIDMDEVGLTEAVRSDKLTPNNVDRFIFIESLNVRRKNRISARMGVIV